MGDENATKEQRVRSKSSGVSAAGGGGVSTTASSNGGASIRPPAYNSIQMKSVEEEEESIAQGMILSMEDIRIRYSVQKRKIISLRKKIDYGSELYEKSSDVIYFLETIIDEINGNERGFSRDEVAMYSNNIESALDLEVGLNRQINQQILIQNQIKLEHNYDAFQELASTEISDETKEAYRMAFEKGDKKAASKIGTIINTVEGIASDVNGQMDSVNNALVFVNKYIKIDNAVDFMNNIGSATSKVAGAFGRVKGVYNNVSGALETISKISGNHDSYTNARNGIELMGEAANSVFGYIPGASWYGSYITTAVGNCLKSLDFIRGKAAEQERNTRISLGYENQSMYYSQSPGGEPVFLFMQKVMRASGGDGLNDGDVNSKVKDFFEQQNEGKINKSLGRKKGNNMPVDHGFRNDEIETKEFKKWIFKNRNQIWYMLYGKTDIKKATSE